MHVLHASMMAAAKAAGGKKIRWAARPVRVQVPPPAPYIPFALASKPKRLRVNVYLAISMLTFTDPGTLKTSEPALIFAIAITPGEGINSPSWR